jgi:hypothetical protein
VPCRGSFSCVVARLLDQVSDRAAFDGGEPLGKRIGEFK